MQPFWLAVDAYLLTEKQHVKALVRNRPQSLHKLLKSRVFSAMRQYFAKVHFNFNL